MLVCCFNTLTSWHQNEMVLLSLVLMLVQVVLEMESLPRVIIQISDSNWPNAEIEEKKSFFLYLGVG